MTSLHNDGDGCAEGRDEIREDRRKKGTHLTETVSKLSNPSQKSSRVFGGKPRDRGMKTLDGEYVVLQFDILREQEGSD